MTREQIDQTSTMASSNATRPLPVLSLRAAEIASEAAQKKAREMGIGVLSSRFSIIIHLALLHYAFVKALPFITVLEDHFTS